VRRVDDGSARAALVLRADFDLVAHRPYVRGGEACDATATGAWSRVALRAELGQPADEKGVTGMYFHSRTSLLGRYAQTADGDGMFLGLGTAFTYRRERLSVGWDRAAFAHLLGTQLQLVSRTPARAWRFDLAAYADFAMIQAHALTPSSPLPPPPPYDSSAQVAGYYDGYGTSVIARLRADARPLTLELEVSGHGVWQIDAFDRSHMSPPDPLLIPHGITDWRGYGRASVGYRGARWGIALDATSAVRHGAWRDLSRTSWDAALGTSLTLDF
jgi:hypothetical protein